MINKEKNFVSAVVYVHNDQDKIEYFLQSLIRTLEDNFEHSEIICVNDFSSDNSASLIKQISKDVKCTTVSLINMSYYHGLEMAMNAGTDLSIGDFVFEFDSVVIDYSKNQIMDVYRHALEGFDIVTASPVKRQKLLNKIFYNIIKNSINAKHKITTERFRILSRRVINRISTMNKTVPYRKAIYYNCGLKTDTLYYKPIEKVNASKKKDNKYKRKLATESLIIFTDIGFKCSLFFTIIMMICAILMISYIIVVNIVGTPIEGWTTITLFLSLGFFALFFLLSIVIRYLQVIVELIFKRKQYSVESIEKLTK